MDDQASGAGTGDELAAPSPRQFHAGGDGSLHAASEPPAQPVDDDGWQRTRPAPWRRYFARMLDTIVLGALLWFVLAMLAAALSNAWYRHLFGAGGFATHTVIVGLATFVLVAPVEAWMLGASGTTLGKWVFGVRITQVDGRAIGFLRALRRELRVWLQGLALGIPLFSMIAMIIAWIRLKDEGSTGWDAGKPWVVTYRPRGWAQVVLFVLGATFVIGVWALVVSTALAHRG